MATNFYLNEYYIVGGAVITWLPQILFNIFYRNRLFLPYLSIIALSLSKIVMPFYFSFDDNLFQVKIKAEPVYLAMAVLLVQIFILFLQSAIDPVFFLPEHFRPKGPLVYFNETEIKAILGTDFEQMDCAICIHPLALKGVKLKMEDDFQDLSPNMRCGLRKVLKLFSNYRNFIDLHRIEIVRTKKNYVATSCKHYFHTNCLESWIKIKTECPCCRKKDV